ncbi:MAG: transposase [Bacteroidetes bacterium]|nr:transposase [Bacteroidota bacterium]
MSRKYKFDNTNGIYSITPPLVAKVDLFTKHNYFEIIIDSLRFCQKYKGLVVHSFCIMTNHLHLMISRNGPNIFEDIMRDFKKYTAVQIIKEIKQSGDSRRDWMLEIFKKAGINNPNNTHYQIWQQHNHPIELSDDRMVDQRLNYIHQNPVKAGFVERPEEWKNSSASNYLGLGGVLEVELVYDKL